MKAYTDPVLNPLPKFITALGILCLAVGLSWAFVDGSDFAFRFFSDSFDRFITVNVNLFLIILLIGILSSAIGTVAWTRHFNKRKQFRVAGSIFLVGLFAIVVAPKNVHGHGMLLILTALCAWILSIVLAVIAVATREHAANEVQNPE